MWRSYCWWCYLLTAKSICLIAKNSIYVYYFPAFSSLSAFSWFCIVRKEEKFCFIWLTNSPKSGDLENTVKYSTSSATTCRFYLTLIPYHGSQVSFALWEIPWLNVRTMKPSFGKYSFKPWALLRPVLWPNGKAIILKENIYVLIILTNSKLLLLALPKPTAGGRNTEYSHHDYVLH